MERLSSACCLVLAFAATFAAGAIVLPLPPTLSEEVLFSRDLNPEFLPCRQVTFPCNGGIPGCARQEDYARLEFGPRPLCPLLENATQIPPPGECGLVDGECAFSEGPALSCVSWRPDCALEYSCTTEAEYEARPNRSCPVFFAPPPTPEEVCVAQDGECKRYNPCTTWQGHCNGEYNCGSRLEYGRFLSGPIPFCLPHSPFRRQPRPQGECLYRDGECQWSACRSWLGHCRTSWNCGSEYDFQVFQSLPVPPCANPGPDFVPPPRPGVCQFNLTQGQCAFAPQCEGGMEYTECGSRCPQSCERLFGTQEDLLLCPTVCVPGCFCPNHLVLHNGRCIPPSQCPNANPCEPSPCEEDQACKVEELPCIHPPYCPSRAICVDLNPCEPDPCRDGQECQLVEVQCVRAPCPPVHQCVDRVRLEVNPRGSGVVVTIEYTGARSIRVIVRDSKGRRHTKFGRGSSVTLTFQDLPRGLTRVRANVRTQDREKISSEWVEIRLRGSQS